MKRDEPFPSKFWKASDLKGGPVTLTKGQDHFC
jgi:hypothetical protein